MNKEQIKSQLKASIQQYVDQPTWTDKERWDVMEFVSHLRRQRGLIALNVEDNDVEKLRSVLIEFLENFDTLIDELVEQKTHKSWWDRNSNWLLTLIGLLLMVLGLLLRFWDI